MEPLIKPLSLQRSVAAWMARPRPRKSTHSWLHRSALLLLSCSAAWRAVAWVGSPAPSRAYAHRRSPGAGPCAAAPEDTAASTSGTDEKEEIDLETARAAMQAAKLRLEAAKLRMEVEQASPAAISQASSSPAPEPGTAAGTSDASVPSVATLEAELAGNEGATPNDSTSPVEVGAEAMALADSSALRDAANTLLKLRRSAGGDAALEKLVLQGCDALENGMGDVDTVLSNANVDWDAAGISTSEAKQALCGAVDLLTPRGSPQAEVKLQPQPDRAAVLRIMLHDQGPDIYSGYAQVLDLDDQPTTNADGMTDVSIVDPSITQGLTPEIKDAALFSRRLEKIPSEDERTRTRLKRLKEMPLVQQFATAVESNADLAEVANALSPWELRIYNAVREAQLRKRPEEDKQQVSMVSLEFSLAQVIGALVVSIALAYVAAQFAKGALNPQQDGFDNSQVPLYSLSNTRPSSPPRS